jgi:general secretion pathway protein G
LAIFFPTIKTVEPYFATDTISKKPLGGGEIMIKHFQNQRGFTLIEMLIVIIILGILAMIIIPQISVSTEDARLNTLKSNLGQLRSVIEIYYHQHTNNYPANAVPGTKPADVTDLPTTFIAQLSRYTDANGNIQNSKDTTFKYGPYVSGIMPSNPYNEKNDMTIDNTTTDITTKVAGGNTGWKFYSNTGVLIANDGAAGHVGY